ncbi:hypothetical protein K461DRAFT_327598 [Myriangium duriaei CBS 260.36]|uniref:Uncharacterized protein n=1 Tax=Myriangium duriaei CBS 260.36 TaxID=1168546 RepID=A0A9P4J6C6_9PEZI|nr:hypothetical protein K461DRAFT_327598 [Myriangium duriaei CBS 260.36]
MLFTASSSPRRLGLLAVLVFCFTLVLFRRSHIQHAASYQFAGVHPVDSDGSDRNIIHPDDQDRKENTGTVVAEVEKVLEPAGQHTNAKPEKIVVDDLPVLQAFNGSDGPVTAFPKLAREDEQKFIKDITDWDTLDTSNHWPTWDAYDDLDYDPNRWEGFDWETGYFAHNGIEHLRAKDLKPQPYLPYPKYGSVEWSRTWRGEYSSCQGPRGLNMNESIQDMPFAWRHPAPSFPQASVGSSKVVGLPENVCFDRYSRYGAYGLGEKETKEAAGWDKPKDNPEWQSTRWGYLQDSCLLRNKRRYDKNARNPMDLKPTKAQPLNMDTFDEAAYQNKFASTPKYHSRTALLIRTWEGYTYTENDLQAIRSLITELSLLTGGEYQVFLFVNVKQKDADIYNDPQVYQDILKKVVPQELRDISLLWTEKVCEEWYPKVGDWQVYWQQFMPLQWFSKTHPEFDYVWNWETDARYTGNHYEFLEKMVEFARNMPRKNLWERNARFYFPKSHGNFASFLADTDHAIANATAEGKMTPVWGPQPYPKDQVTFGPQPPTTYEADNFEWGVGEEADLITLQPIWDPHQTEWSYRYKIWNYIKGKAPHFTSQDPGDDAFFHPDFAKVPRRVFINTVARFSKRLLHAMHTENRAGRSMQAEMWPASVALQHGLKAVYSPHPIWLDRKWSDWYLDATFNANGGETAAWGARKDSPYNHDREAAFRGYSWYYSTSFPRTLYRRWLGWRARDILGDVGGEDYEDREGRISDQVAGTSDPIIGGKGRMCLPGMLLHPVKKVKEDDGVEVEVARATEDDRRKEREVAREVKRVLEERGFYWPGEKPVRVAQPPTAQPGGLSEGRGKAGQGI